MSLAASTPSPVAVNVPQFGAALNLTRRYLNETNGGVNNNNNNNKREEDENNQPMTVTVAEVGDEFDADPEWAASVNVQTDGSIFNQPGHDVVAPAGDATEQHRKSTAPPAPKRHEVKSRKKLDKNKATAPQQHESGAPASARGANETAGPVEQSHEYIPSNPDNIDENFEYPLPLENELEEDGGDEEGDDDGESAGGDQPQGQPRSRYGGQLMPIWEDLTRGTISGMVPAVFEIQDLLVEAQRSLNSANMRVSQMISGDYGGGQPAMNVADDELPIQQRVARNAFRQASRSRPRTN